MIAEEVIILNQSHSLDDVSIPMCQQGYISKSQLSIGNVVWIGTRVIILPQVTKIESGVIIGAGLVVTRNVADFAIVGGYPARVTRYRR